MRCRAKTCMNCGSTRAPHTASEWPTIQSTTPESTVAGPADSGGQRAVGDRHGARRTQQNRLGRDAAAPRSRPQRCPGHSYDRPAGEAEERQEEARSGKRDGQTEDDLDQLADVSPKASARPVAMMMMTATIRATGLDGFEDGLQRAFPRHRGTGGLRGSGQEQQRGQQQPSRRTGQAAQPRKTQSRICRKRKAGMVIGVMAVLQVSQGGKSPQRVRHREVAAAGKRRFQRIRQLVAHAVEADDAGDALDAALARARRCGSPR